MIEEIVDYNVSALITWQLPCNTNGELEYFVLAINGTPTFEGAESVYENISIAKNSIIENTAYEYTISKIQAAYEYTVGVFAVLDDDTEGDSVEINFTSPDGCMWMNTFFVQLIDTIFKFFQIPELQP